MLEGRRQAADMTLGGERWFTMWTPLPQASPGPGGVNRVGASALFREAIQHLLLAAHHAELLAGDALLDGGVGLDRMLLPAE